MNTELKMKYKRLIDKYAVHLLRLPALEKTKYQLNGESGVYVCGITGNCYLESDIKAAINLAIISNIRKLRELATAREKDILE